MILSNVELSSQTGVLFKLKAKEFETPRARKSKLPFHLLFHFLPTG